MYDVMDLLLIANIPIFTVYIFQKTLNTSFDFDLFIIIKLFLFLFILCWIVVIGGTLLFSHEFDNDDGYRVNTYKTFFKYIKKQTRHVNRTILFLNCLNQILEKPVLHYSIRQPELQSSLHYQYWFFQYNLKNQINNIVDNKI